RRCDRGAEGPAGQAGVRPFPRRRLPRLRAAVMEAAAIRSLLFVPGDREDMILKALGSAADAVIVDLEDAVAPERKAAAREVTGRVLAQADRRGRPVVVRLNAFDTGLTAGDAAAVL